MRKIIISFVLLIQMGCSTATYMPLNIPNSKEARVYFIRENAEPTMWNLWIYVDGKKAASLSNKSYVAFSVPVGTREILLDWPPTSSVAKLYVDLDLSESKDYYYVIKGKSRLVGTSPSYNGITMHVNESISLIEVSKREAKTILYRVGT